MIKTTRASSLSCWAIGFKRMIQVFYEGISPEEIPVFPEKLVSDIILTEGKKLGDLAFIICDEDYLLKINQDFLQHDYHTDVITFHSVRGKTISGEIFISFPMIMENAAKNSVGTRNEFFRVVSHGILHLCGYGDKTPEEIIVMRQKEDFYIARHL